LAPFVIDVGLDPNRIVPSSSITLVSVLCVAPEPAGLRRIIALTGCRVAGFSGRLAIGSYIFTQEERLHRGGSELTKTTPHSPERHR
jgi:hypothetical protein